MSTWDRVTRRHIKPGAQMGVPINIVDYTGISTDPDFAQFIQSLATMDLSTLSSRNESMALGINAYNALAAKTMIDHACKYEDQANNKGKCLGPNYGLTGIQFADGTKGTSAKIHSHKSSRA